IQAPAATVRKREVQAKKALRTSSALAEVIVLRPRTSGTTRVAVVTGATWDGYREAVAGRGRCPSPVVRLGAARRPVLGPSGEAGGCGMVGTRRNLISVCPLTLCGRRLLRRSLGGIGDDRPIGEPHDTRAARGHALILGDENERGPPSRRGVEQFREHLGGGAGVEGAGGFVGEGHHGLRDLGA